MTLLRKCEQISETQPFHQHFVEMYNDQFLTDFVLKMNDGQEIQAHKAAVASRSPVFKQMLATNMKETKNGIVEIDDINLETMKHVLQWIYTNKVGNIDEIAGGLVYAAEKYGLEGLKRICIEKLIEELSTKNAIDTFKISEIITGAQDLRDRSIEFIDE